MPDIIQLLPDAIANQIAAGEVVQRPASVVKELLENAIDAGSTAIQLVVKDAGKQLIQVIDDGCGMSATDARMSFERHATSKIKQADDLFKIKTMGFRGEALASIAAVAQVEMKTCPEGEELGHWLMVEASEVKKQEPAACPEGTNLSIKNLFYNVPARRNFLKSNAVELKHIIEEFQRVALAHPEIRFTFHQNDIDVYNLPAGKLSQRIVGLFGKSYREQMAACNEDTDHLKVHGYIGKPEFAKRSRGEQYFFVNNRFIKSGYLHHAVMNAYEGLLPADSFPFYVLFLEIDPRHVDVNVHPTKTEIKFDDERTVYGIMQAAVKQALGSHNIAPALDFEQDVNFGSFRQAKPVDMRRDYGGGHKMPKDKEGTADINWDEILKNFHDTQAGAKAEEEGHEDHSDGQEAVTFGSAVNQMSGGEPKQEMAASENITFQIHQEYIATQVKSGLMLVDQQSAHERILYEKYSTALVQHNGASQQFLFPQTVHLEPGDYALVMEMKESLHFLGFSLETLGKDAVIVQGAPPEVADREIKDVFEGLIEQFKYNQQALSIPKQENLVRAFARRSAIKKGKKLNLTEMISLIDKLFACKNPNYAPDGKRTFYIFDLNQIASFFNK